MSSSGAPNSSQKAEFVVVQPRRDALDLKQHQLSNNQTVKPVGEAAVLPEAVRDLRQTHAVNAAKSGDTQALLHLATEGVDLGAICASTNISPMEAAIQSDHWEIVHYLWYLGVDLNKHLSRTGVVPLHYAISQKRMHEVKWLSSNGARMKVKAVRYEHPEEMDLSLEKKMIPRFGDIQANLWDALTLAREVLPTKELKTMIMANNLYWRHEFLNLLPIVNWVFIITICVTLEEVLELGIFKKYEIPWLPMDVPPPAWITANGYTITGLFVALYALFFAALMEVMGGAEKIRMDLSDKGVFCSTCQGFRPPKARHCYFSGRCIPEYSCYCHALHRAIGKGNFKAYMAFLSVGTVLFIILAILWLQLGSFTRAIICVAGSLPYAGAWFRQMAAQSRGLTLNEYENNHLP